MHVLPSAAVFVVMNVQRPPLVVIVTGPPGSGKTSQQLGMHAGEFDRDACAEEPTATSATRGEWPRVQGDFRSWPARASERAHDNSRSE
jgi:hypothetical protein